MILSTVCSTRVMYFFILQFIAVEKGHLKAAQFLYKAGASLSCKVNLVPSHQIQAACV